VAGSWSTTADRLWGPGSEARVAAHRAPGTRSLLPEHRGRGLLRFVVKHAGPAHREATRVCARRTSWCRDGPSLVRSPYVSERVEAYIHDLFTATRERAATEPLDLPRGQRCLDSARRLPLSHGLRGGGKATSFLGDGTPELRSPRQQGTRPSAARAFAGTEDEVCFWVGPLRIPDRPLAIVLSADVETSSSTATPWDSGGIHRRRGLHLVEPERQRLVRESRRLPAPRYRDALAAAIFVRHGEPDRYADGELLCSVDPDLVCAKGDPSSFTFEARIPGRVRLLTRSLLFVAASRDQASFPGVHRLRSWCLSAGVEFEIASQHAASTSVMAAVAQYFHRSYL
jgi:hypothetical protein